MKRHHSIDDNQTIKSGFNQCRTCYKHLAGYVGVVIAEAMVACGYLKESNDIYLITNKGWEWFLQFDISENDFQKSRRLLTRQCIDGTERRPHLAGQLGDILLEKMLLKGWFDKVESTRELRVTPKGRQSLHEHLGIDIKA